MGISLENLHTWEYRKAVPAPRQVEAIARAYELPVEKVVLMRCELALGRKPTGMLSPGIHAYSLADWTRGEPYKALAVRCGVHVNTLSRWVNGQNVPESRHIPRLAEVLGRSEADVAVACYKAWELPRPARPAYAAPAGILQRRVPALRADGRNAGRRAAVDPG